MLKYNGFEDDEPTMNHRVGCPTDPWGAIVLSKRRVDKRLCESALIWLSFETVAAT
jgi:hypothetical protein